MPETSITRGVIRVSYIGIRPVYDSSRPEVLFKISNNAFNIGITDPNRCNPQIGQVGLSVRIVTIVDGEETGSNTVCVPQYHNDAAGAHITQRIPFNVPEGVHDVRFRFEFANDGRVIGESESFQVEKMAFIPDGRWETIGDNEHHETGDIVTVETYMDIADGVPFRDVWANAVADLIRVQTEVNADLAGEERITVLDAELADSPDPNHDYLYRLTYHVDHASPISSVSVIGVLVAAAVFAFAVALTINETRKLVETEGGATVAGLGGVALAGGAAWLVLREMNKRDDGKD